MNKYLLIAVLFLNNYSYASNDHFSGIKDNLIAAIASHYVGADIIIQEVLSIYNKETEADKINALLSAFTFIRPDMDLVDRIYVVEASCRIESKELSLFIRQSQSLLTAKMTAKHHSIIAYYLSAIAADDRQEFIKFTSKLIKKYWRGGDLVLIIYPATKIIVPDRNAFEEQVARLTFNATDPITRVNILIACCKISADDRMQFEDDIQLLMRPYTTERCKEHIISALSEIETTGRRNVAEHAAIIINKYMEGSEISDLIHGISKIPIADREVYTASLALTNEDLETLD